jgi:hypothetical protein
MCGTGCDGGTRDLHLDFSSMVNTRMETLKAQELAEEKTVAMRSYKESLKLAQTMVCVLALTYKNVKMSIGTFCAFLWTLFGDKCDY